MKMYRKYRWTMQQEVKTLYMVVSQIFKRYWFIVDSLLQKLVKSSENISLIAHAVPVLVTKVTLESQMSVCPSFTKTIAIFQNPNNI